MQANLAGAGTVGVIRPVARWHVSCRPAKSHSGRQRQVLGLTRAVIDKPGGGAGLLERPDLDRSQPTDAPRTESGSSGAATGKQNTLGGGNYRVLLLDDEKHTEERCVAVLPRTVPGLSKEQAQNAFHTSRQLGVALIVSCLKEHAEFYASQIYRQGLRSTIEPDTTTI